MLHTNLSNMLSDEAMSSMACQQPSIHPSSAVWTTTVHSTSKQGVKLENNWSQCTECYKKNQLTRPESKSHTKPNVGIKNQKISITKHRWFMVITRHHRWCSDRMGPKWTTLSNVLLLSSLHSVNLPTLTMQLHHWFKGTEDSQKPSKKMWPQQGNGVKTDVCRPHHFEEPEVKVLPYGVTPQAPCLLLLIEKSYINYRDRTIAIDFLESNNTHL